MSYWIFTDPNNGSFSNTKFREFGYTLLTIFMVSWATVCEKIFDPMIFIPVLGALMGISVGGMMKSHADKKLGNGK